ncbi:DUF397 domain-containing protein [Streptomyces benahoarensis]|uniref:DUF397 domain-containing protein n=1 Tax=Streptomyces benahoarensis TaxID=2595054 RepID=A0A553ZQ25_9ACTN|nr:DUF397 domain-containing protein [Streptomyces benahoarensis]TSB31607.1 DUF397 domain-containing protein [Streptomyces benahoarensis]TSB43574.1 DUF397 domain-containing protein [Streptomyces benahoarensis]
MPPHEWQKSSFSGEGAQCLHVAAPDSDTIKVCESDAPDVILTTSRANLKAFILGVKAGEFDHFVDG